MPLINKIQAHITENYPEQEKHNIENSEGYKEFRINLNKFEEEEFNKETWDGFDNEDIIDKWNLDTYSELYCGVNEMLGNEKYMDIHLRLEGEFPDKGKLRDILRNGRIDTFTSEGIVMSINSMYYEPVCWRVECNKKTIGIVNDRKTQVDCSFCDDILFRIPKKCPICNQKWEKINKDFRQEERISENVSFIQIGYYTKDNQIATVNAFVYGINTDDIRFGQRLKFNAFKDLEKFGKDKYVAKLMIVGWESSDITWEDITIPEEYESKFMQNTDTWKLLQQMIQSFAPDIVGYEDIKETILLQSCMGGFIKTIGGGVERDWMSILLGGDPGVAKSKLLSFAGRLHPKTAYGGGARTSKAGLTVAIVQDPLNKDRKIPKAGALVMADNGLACLDEFDKMSAEDKKSIQSAMEQGRVDVAMADTQATFETKTSILAACNPKKAFFDRKEGYETEMIEQIDISWEILSRFDFIWIMIDIDHTQRDEEISRTMRGSPDIDKPIFDIDEMRYYIAWIRSRDPVINEDLGMKIDKWYSHQRNEMKDERKINPRVLRSLIRASKAVAKFRGTFDHINGNYIVTDDDFEEAKRLYRAMLSTHGPTQGFGDINRWYRGQSLKRDTIHTRITECIATYTPTNDELFDYLSDIDDDLLEKELERLQNQRKGGIFKDRTGVWRCV
jgi:DNA replicative helicase MCM subunit Mcm2 (Cdc46/Mcm family)